jgi:uncharacterized repeat protein (TIGR02543 family)
MKNILLKRKIYGLRIAATFTICAVLTAVGMPAIESASGAAQFHTVTLVENDNGSDPVFATQAANTATPLTLVASLSPTFSNAGYTFEAWNTSPDGTGTTYLNGATYPFANSAALYAIWLKIFHTVTFIENDSPTDTVFSTQSANIPTPLTTFSNINPLMVHPGYSFIDWNTAPDASGTPYANGAIFNFSLSTGLYAIWQEIPTVTESFAANGGNGIVTPITVQAGTTTNLPLSSGMTNPGFSFAGWNTAPDGSGTQYAGGATYTFTGSQVLYAQWIPNVYTITFAYDGGVVGSTSTSFTVGNSALILPNATNNGFVFAGWFTQAVGGVLVGLSASAFTPTESSTIYAQWVPVASYSVTFSANGAIGSIAPISGNVDSSIVLPTVTGLSNAGFAFSGWNTSADGSGTQYAGGSNYLVSSALTLFAQWIPGPSDTLTFNANGGSGSVPPIVGAPGSTITLPDSSGFILAGFLISKWNTSPKGTGTSYSFGQALRLTGSIVLYAQWKGHKPVALFGAIGAFKKNSSTLTSALKSQINRIALTVKSKKYSIVNLYGYTATTGLASLNMSLSRARAQHVAQFLHLRLKAMRVNAVSIRSAGEGAIAGESSAAYSRVEVFGV